MVDMNLKVVESNGTLTINLKKKAWQVKTDNHFQEDSVSKTYRLCDMLGRQDDYMLIFIIPTKQYLLQRCIGVTKEMATYEERMAWLENRRLSYGIKNY